MSHGASPTPENDRVYYPELDGLRFVAFALVYLFHRGVPSLPGWINGAARAVSPGLVGPRGGPGDVLVGNGWVGVQLFFILSGYLITTLLLREEARYGRVDLRAFWARRILRIWPLYYLVVLIGFTLLPWLMDLSWPNYAQMCRTHLLPLCVFLGNWSMGLNVPPPFDALTVLWSVCVEEQFYLFVPLLVAKVSPRWRIATVVVLMAAGVAGRYALALAWSRGSISPVLLAYATVTHLDTLLSGVLLALILARRPPGARAARLAAWGQVVMIVLALWLLTTPNLARGTPARETWGYVAIWLAGAGVVASIEIGRGPLRAALSYSRLVWLGKISYGLYMYHELALTFVLRRHDRFPWFPNKEPLLMIATFAATVGLAALSYYAWERRFLRLKRAWTRVPSRPV